MPEVTEEVKKTTLHKPIIWFRSANPFSHTLQGVRKC
jgi:hypothetical protein